MIPQVRLQKTGESYYPFRSFSWLSDSVDRVIGTSDSSYGSYVKSDICSFEQDHYHELVGISKGAEKNQPWLEQYDGFGRRLDKIHVSTEWRLLHFKSSVLGIGGLPYESKNKVPIFSVSNSASSRASLSESSFGRVHWCLKHLLYGSVSGLYSCPLAMTDGAARCLRDYLDAPSSSTLPPSDRARLECAFSNLTSRNPLQFWTSGQWMTEYQGGSDVSRATETVATVLDASSPKSENGFYSHQLSGFKWFTSATDADCALVLAREIDPSTNKPFKKLSLFYVELKKGSPLTQAYKDEKNRQISELNIPACLSSHSIHTDFTNKDKDVSCNTSSLTVPFSMTNRTLKDEIEVVRLKEKMGTKQMPTAELILNNLPAKRIGDTGRGVAMISTMLNITRLHNAVAAVSFMIRGFQIAVDYNVHRHAFNKQTIDLPLQNLLFKRIEVDVKANGLLCVDSAERMQINEKIKAKKNINPDVKLTDDEVACVELQRLLTPGIKIFTAKNATTIQQELMESIGGMAYMESTGFPTLLRDTHVLPIWEGTSHVLSLDVIRAIQKSKGHNLMILHNSIKNTILQAKKAVENKNLTNKNDIFLALEAFDAGNNNLKFFIDLVQKTDSDKSMKGLESCSRILAWGITRLSATQSLLKHAIFINNKGTSSKEDVEREWNDVVMYLLQRSYLLDPIDFFNMHLVKNIIENVQSASNLNKFVPYQNTNKNSNNAKL